MELTDQQQQNLLTLAENSIKEYLGLAPNQVTCHDPLFEEKSGIFVTLQKDHQLRGCIGSLVAQQSIIDGVQYHAINAAFNDQRFQPVTAEELADIRIEILILSKPQPLAFSDSADLLQQLQPGLDGVTLHYGPHSATFLPQVWEQLPAPELFLSHLCQKAGLAPDQWQQDGLSIETYRVSKF